VQRLFEQLQRIGMIQPLNAFVCLDFDTTIPSLETQKGARADEAVTPKPFAADDAFEQERPIALTDFAKSGHRRERVADKLPVNRHQGMRLGQLEKLIQGGTETHA